VYIIISILLKIKIFLSFPGEAFCLSEELNLDEEALQMCFRNVKHLIPLAMPAIDHAVHEHTHHICRDWFHGLCKDDDIPPPMEMMMTDEDEKI